MSPTARLGSAGFVPADDLEPLDGDERCDAAWGPHHIGRHDETRMELALMFDPRWLPGEWAEAELEELVWQALRPFNGHLHGWAAFWSPNLNDEQLFDLLTDHLQPAKPFDFDPVARLIVAVVDLPEEIHGLKQVLEREPSYVGHCNLSWPSDLRTMVYADLDYT